ncbi:TIR domain-containing protein [Vibrio sp.]|uniref:TIR domain-containing protein n=1 Tax=Vibrio viridaestus TaxID=2487322 RepID=A0A3N9TLY3_9VIBR|nr:TIR domain-containing protein [Vibrio viridaestus]MDC0610595.1 TIR domain-containing protein [Vibrio sp.]RQW65101.1 TIR domain-containing protein [Vibrio viridaestus]
MKIFISHSQQDRQYAGLINDALVSAGHDVQYDTWTMRTGENYLKRIEENTKTADVLILLVSRNSASSKTSIHEFSAIALNDLSKQEQRIIPVIIDKGPIPTYLSQYMYVDISQDITGGIRRLTELLEPDKLIETTVLSDALREEQREEARDKKIKDLAKALHEGRMTLVCGAGISVGAGVPAWNDLLIHMLRAMITRMSADHGLEIDSGDADRFHTKYSPSALVVGKYLKNNLGKDFLKELRHSLYISNPETCEVLEAIVDLARPQRDGNPLDSIITFNFDALLEENLDLQNIKYRAIYGEGVRNSPNELPIYHVHGYLPRKGKIPPNMDVIFSEDAYHSHFIEPFSWSNLIQLNKLSQNTCLFIGLSLTDPNLRRLLDVANRKNTDKHLNHYFIKKTPSVSKTRDTMDKLALLLEEQDANELGLSMIWVEHYSEVPSILRQIALASAMRGRQ